MKVLFLLLQMPEDIMSSNMYIELLEEFKNHGHEVTVIAPSYNKKTYIGKEREVKVLRVKTLKTQNVSSMIKKGIGLALLPYFFKKAYKKYLNNNQFDWIFMPTPPITLIDFVKNLKNKT